MKRVVKAVINARTDALVILSIRTESSSIAILFDYVADTQLFYGIKIIAQILKNLTNSIQWSSLLSNS